MEPFTPTALNSKAQCRVAHADLAKARWHKGGRLRRQLGIGRQKPKTRSWHEKFSGAARMPPPYRLRFEMVGQSRPRDAVTSSISGFFVMDYLRDTTLATDH